MPDLLNWYFCKQDLRSLAVSFKCGFVAIVPSSQNRTLYLITLYCTPFLVPMTGMKLERWLRGWRIILNCTFLFRIYFIFSFNMIQFSIYYHLIWTLLAFIPKWGSTGFGGVTYNKCVLQDRDSFTNNLGNYSLTTFWEILCNTDICYFKIWHNL